MAGATVELLVGLVVFTLGLTAFVFPRIVAASIADRIGGRAGDQPDEGPGHRATVAVRAVGLVGAVAGFALLVL